MAEPAMPEGGGLTVLDDLPEFIVIQEILVRLPAKDIFRCRAVRRSWRKATSTDEFIQSHHRHQPSMPIIEVTCENKDCRLSVFRDSSSEAPNKKLQPLLRFVKPHALLAVCDGFLLISSNFGLQEVYICNPATRQLARLKTRDGLDAMSRLVAFYRHHGEYRQLSMFMNYREQKAEYYVLSEGSEKPRCIGRPPGSSRAMEMQLLMGRPISSHYPYVHHRGSLHWVRYGLDEEHRRVPGDIMVFDTEAEAFRWMRRPSELGPFVSLLEVGGKLALCSNKNGYTMDISVLQDYEAEAWAFKYRINLSAVEAPPYFDFAPRFPPRMAMLNDRELLIQHFDAGLLHCATDGKVLQYVKSEDDQYQNWLSRYYLQEYITSLPFSKTIEDGCVEEEPPIIIEL